MNKARKIILILNQTAGLYAEGVRGVCSFSPEIEFTPLILASKSEFS